LVIGTTQTTIPLQFVRTIGFESRQKRSFETFTARTYCRKTSRFTQKPFNVRFLGLGEKNSYSESDLEQGIITKLQEFLLELGKGFLFEARQKRFTFDNEHFFVDLVFYNRLLQCYVLIDLK